VADGRSRKRLRLILGKEKETWRCEERRVERREKGIADKTITPQGGKERRRV